MNEREAKRNTWQFQLWFFAMAVAVLALSYLSYRTFMDTRIASSQADASHRELIRVIEGQTDEIKRAETLTGNVTKTLPRNEEQAGGNKK